MVTEIWETVKGYEGLYEVSNEGRVRSLDHEVPNGANSFRIAKGRVLRQRVNSNGYLRVCLCKENKRKDFYVHRLVVEAFIGAIPNGLEVNHIDMNRANNNLANLEIVTNSENKRKARELNWTEALEKQWEQCFAKRQETNKKLKEVLSDK